MQFLWLLSKYTYNKLYLHSDLFFCMYSMLLHLLVYTNKKNSYQHLWSPPKSAICFVLKPLHYFMFSFGFFLPPFFYVQNVWERMGSIALDFFGEKKNSSGKNFLKSITDTMCHVCFSVMLYHLHRDSETLEKFLSGCITLRTSGNISLVSAEALQSTCIAYQDFPLCPFVSPAGCYWIPGTLILSTNVRRSTKSHSAQIV